jgi:hypothetical protein
MSCDVQFNPGTTVILIVSGCPSIRPSSSAWSISQVNNSRAWSVFRALTFRLVQIDRFIILLSLGMVYFSGRVLSIRKSGEGRVAREQPAKDRR